jgi:hypothetical protein
MVIRKLLAHSHSPTQSPPTLQPHPRQQRTSTTRTTRINAHDAHRWSAAYPPVKEVASGDVVHLWTVSGEPSQVPMDKFDVPEVGLLHHSRGVSLDWLRGPYRLSSTGVCDHASY